jgi:AhpC/TSA family.
MRLRTYVLTVSVALFTMAVGTKDARPSEGINPGDLAPRIKSLGNKDNLSFQNENRRYTLLCFWAAYDAESRVRNVQLSKEVEKLDSDNIEMYSVSFDENQSIFNETLKIDGLKVKNQFNESDSKPALYKQFKLDKGLKTYLIDDKGIIVAVNFNPKRLTEYLKES